MSVKVVPRISHYIKKKLRNERLIHLGAVGCFIFKCKDFAIQIITMYLIHSVDNSLITGLVWNRWTLGKHWLNDRNESTFDKVIERLILFPLIWLNNRNESTFYKILERLIIFPLIPFPLSRLPLQQNMYGH